MTALKQVLEIMDLVDGWTTGVEVADFLRSRGLEVGVTHVQEERGQTDFLRVRVPGLRGKAVQGTAPTLGIVGRLGGVGARPGKVGLVSDGDGAVAALAAALKLGDMASRGDRLDGDVIIGTHVCPNAPMIPHEPVPFMGPPVAMETMNRLEVDAEMDAILSIDTTRGNRVVNHKGMAVTPTVVDGYLLPVSESLLSIYERVCGAPPVVLPLSLFDVTPYGNGLYHINSIVQPATATDHPVVGVAITAQSIVPGSGTGASQPLDITAAATFCVEVAKDYGVGQCVFYDKEQYALASRLYGSLSHLRTSGRA